MLLLVILARWLVSLFTEKTFSNDIGAQWRSEMEKQIAAESKIVYVFAP